MHYFIKLFYLLQSKGIFDSILYGGTMPVASSKNRVKAISFDLIRKTFSVFQIFISDPQENSQYSTLLVKKYSFLHYLSQSEHLQACKTYGFLFCLIFLVNFPQLLNTLIFPHSSSMNTSLGKSFKFPTSSISNYDNFF